MDRNILAEGRTWAIFFFIWIAGTSATTAIVVGEKIFTEDGPSLERAFVGGLLVSAGIWFLFALAATATYIGFESED